MIELNYEQAIKAIQERHSVRKYLDKKIEAEKVELLKQFCAVCSEDSEVHFELVEDAGNIFNRLLNKAMGLGSAPSCIACYGAEGKMLEETIGYYGEKIVLYAQSLGLNTCWAGTFNHKEVPVQLEEGERLVIVIAIGYGATQGKPHKSKKPEQVMKAPANRPKEFDYGVEMALLAPTALNQQKFEIGYNENGSIAFTDKGGLFSKVDLGIVKCHFGLGIEYAKQGK